MTIPKRRTKIIATIGPASSSREVIAELIESGLNVARLNFSHGTHEDHLQSVRMIREESKRLERPVAILQDLSGPKIRIGPIQDGEVILEDNQTIQLIHLTDEQVGSTSAIYVEAFNPGDVLDVGHRVLLSDGQIELIVEDVNDAAVLCRIIAGGKLRSRSGIAVPDSELSIGSLTDKDRTDVLWGIQNDVDYVALSFVASEHDILGLRDYMKEHGGNIPIVAKIERGSSLDHISEIVETSDAIMVARGDLGLELPLERVPNAQKLIVNAANAAGKPVIIATQLLMSMVTRTRPTRAEVSDVCTAVWDGTSAVMLSDETAIGTFPVLAVRMLDKITSEAETALNYESYKRSPKGTSNELIPDSICYAACTAADKVASSAIIACTQSGYSARLVSKYRPHQPLFGATPEAKTLRRMALYWGVIPLWIDVPDGSSTEDEVMEAMNRVRDIYGVKPGARVVLTAGLRVKATGTTNILEIREIPRHLTSGLRAKANRLLRHFQKK